MLCEEGKSQYLKVNELRMSKGELQKIKES